MHQFSSIKKELLPWFEKMFKEEEDRQALITRGYKSLKAATYLLLQVNEGEKEVAKAYFNSLIPVITNSKKNDKQLNEDGDPMEAIHIAFTSSGLRRLGMREEVLNTFSREFIEGMTHTYKKDSKEIKERSILLGDVGSNDPDWWQWQNDEKKEHKEARVDVGLFFYAATNSKLEELIVKHYTKDTAGLKEVYEANTLQISGKHNKEHFGFRDGISQPIIKGFSKSNIEQDKQKWINPGEFILGHINEYDDYSPSPCVPLNAANSQELPSLNFDLCNMDLGKNGTYLVFRQMEQHVERFLKYIYASSKEQAGTKMEKAVKLASKMVGRWPEGQPLVTYPNGGCPMDRRSLNDFYYEDKDPNGVNCPIGAHIRRTNPRDQVHTGRDSAASMEMSKKHRLLRRGRIYGTPVDPDFEIEKMIEKVKNTPDTPVTVGKITPNRGLHFIALVSDIGRQFEFVQSVWSNTAAFGHLCNEVDPVISPRPTADQPNCHEFTTPQETVRNRYIGVPMFTTVVGGAYFFLPGMNALRYILK